MTQNLGDADRAGRMLAGGALTVAFFMLPSGTVSLVVGVVTIDLLVTSLAGWSPLYFVLRRSTRSATDAKPLPPS
jgi:hypothetical protein